MAKAKKITADDWDVIATALGGEVAEKLKAAILEWDVPAAESRYPSNHYLLKVAGTSGGSGFPLSRE